MALNARPVKRQIIALGSVVKNITREDSFLVVLSEYMKAVKQRVCQLVKFDQR